MSVRGRTLNYNISQAIAPAILLMGVMDMDVLMECCCGLDVHRDMVEACILRGTAAEPQAIREQFQTTRRELSRLARWLYDNGCRHIAMESTGVYWRPVYETIEAQSPGYDCLMVVNARHMRNLPGRKSDVKDAEWIATLLRYGLLENSFIPERIIRDLREFVRLRRIIVQERNRHINRLEKFLQTHGFKLSSVLNDILCVSGRKLLNTLAQTGSLSPEDVLEAAGRRLKRPMEEITAAVCGSINRPERAILRLLLKKLDEVEGDLVYIDEQTAELTAGYGREMALLDSIPGIDALSAATLLGELGPAPQESFPTPGHLNSWAGLVPRNDESAGKVKSRRILPGNPYIKTILCQVAWVAVRVRGSPFHAWFWSHQGHLGRKKAIIAVARKILKLIYRLLESGLPYDAERAALA